MQITQRQLENLKNIAKILNDFVLEIEKNTGKKTERVKENKVSLKEILSRPHSIENLNIDPRIYSGMPASKLWELYPELKLEGE